MEIKTIKEADLKNKKVLVRADLNVPLKGGKVQDTTRIEGLKPTVDYLMEQDAKIALCSHLGRPGGQENQELSLKQITTELGEILGIKVQFIPDCISPEIPQAIENNEVLLLENTRFHKEEKENDTEFAKKLAEPFDIFVNDAFGTAHRAHASTEGVTHHLDSYSGLLIEKEIQAISPLLNEKKVDKPLTLVLGGAKVDTKIGIIKSFIGKADNILIGGALANTFLLAQGYDIGNSKVEEDKIEIAREILLMADKEGTTVITPKDVVVADSPESNISSIDIPIEDVELNMMILDIGKITSQNYADIIDGSKTVILNGPMGLYEKQVFAKGTKEILEALVKNPGTTIVGGGDTTDALNNFKMDKSKFTHISTGGGAMIEFLEGKTLPGIKPLLK